MENKFVVEQKPLIAILSSMQPICTKRTTLDTTSYIMFHVGHKELILKATDLEISLQSSYLLKESDVDATQSRSFLVQGRRIYDLVKELDGEISCTITDQQLLLQSDSVHLSLNIKDAQEFPPFPERIENLMQLDADYVLNMLSRVAFLIPQNNSNPALNGLYLEISDKELKMTATDGHCLAQISTTKYTLDEEKKWLLPRRAILEVKKLLEASRDKTTPIFLGICGNQLVFSGESFNFFSKLLVDPFPQYQGIMDKKGFKPARVDRTNFVKTLRRSACLLSGQFIATQFDFNTDTLNVSMQNKEVGKLQEAIPLAQFEGDTLDIRFYAPYLLNGLQVFPKETLTFYLKSSAKPIIFESKENDRYLLYLVMPVAPTATAS